MLNAAKKNKNKNKITNNKLRIIMKPSDIFKLSLLSTAISLTGCGGGSDDDDNNKTNTIPTVSITSIDANENSQVTLTATAADTDGSIASYSWSLTSAQTIDVTGSTSKTITFTAPSITGDSEEVTFDLIVTDNEGATAKATPIVTVKNIAPTATVAEQTVNEKESVSVMADVNGNGDEIASYLWTQSSGTTVELMNADSDTVTFTAPEISADEMVGLTLTVTDIDNDMVSVDSTVNVNQLTIPLTISGLATDSPITNGEISVNVAGRDITIDVTADENGNYSVDLLLDDSEATSFISIIAHGVAEQANAGLITLLGTAGQLSAKAGEDNILTQNENFAVNVTNITTAQYALAKLANDGENITSDAELETLTQSLNYDEVLTLATAIKVAIDKAANNPNLALPEGITDTLALVENIAATQEYVQGVINEPEFAEAQEEIFEDENLIDTSSVWNVPDVYYVLPQGSLSSGMTLRFNEDGTGTEGAYSFTWEQANGEINANIIEDETIEVSEGFESRLVNGEMVQIRAHYIFIDFSVKRLSSGDNTDIILYKSTQVIHFPDGEVADETKHNSSTNSAVKNNGVIDIMHTGAGIAYLPFNDENPDNSSIVTFRADEFILNADGTAHATVNNMDFTWEVEDGVIKLDIPSSDENTNVPTWKQLTIGSALNQFAHEFIENGEINTGDDFVSEGAILATPMVWQQSTAVGIYTYDNATFSNPLEHFWFELHENGDAETYSSRDQNEDGVLTEDEIYIMYGNWAVNSDGTLVIARVRHQDGYFTEECRYESTENCTLYHERTWRLIGQEGNAYGLFHKHDFKFTNFDWGFESDEIHYDNRTVYKVTSAPVTVQAVVSPTTNLKAKHQSVNSNKKVVTSTRFEKLEPEFK